MDLEDLKADERVDDRFYYFVNLPSGRRVTDRTPLTDAIVQLFLATTQAAEKYRAALSQRIQLERQYERTKLMLSKDERGLPRALDRDTKSLHERALRTLTITATERKLEFQKAYNALFAALRAAGINLTPGKVIVFYDDNSWKIVPFKDRLQKKKKR